MQLGNAFSQIGSVMGYHVGDAIIVDPEVAAQLRFGDANTFFDMESSVYTRDRWLTEGVKTGVFILLRLNTHPIVVVWPNKPEDLEDSESEPERELPHTAVSLEVDGHEYDPIDNTWICKCGNYMEPDAPVCGECPSVNPFLGLII
jgi:hypothetical protein